MAIAQLYGCSGTVARGLRLAASMPRASSSSPGPTWVYIKNKRSESPSIHLSKINVGSVRQFIDAGPFLHHYNNLNLVQDIRLTIWAYSNKLGYLLGGIISVGGLLGFIFSRNPESLFTSVFLGGAIIALGVISLNVWRSGKSSLPYILGQAVIAVAVLRNHMQTYSLTKKLFPACRYIFLSAAMFFFYSYVIISGGNPPPKKKIPAPVS